MLTANDISALMRADHPDAFSVLGMHQKAGALWVNAVLPGAEQVAVLDRQTGLRRATLVHCLDSEVFSAPIPDGTERFDYQLEVTWTPAPERTTPHVQVLEDAYRFPFVLQELDTWLLGEGSHQRPFEALGAHLTSMLGVEGVSFAVWAPNAKRVSVVGSFNQWDGRRPTGGHAWKAPKHMPWEQRPIHADIASMPQIIRPPGRAAPDPDTPPSGPPRRRRKRRRAR